MNPQGRADLRAFDQTLVDAGADSLFKDFTVVTSNASLPDGLSYAVREELAQ